MDVKLAGLFAELAYDPLKAPPAGWEPVGQPDDGYAEGGTQGAFRIYWNTDPNNKESVINEGQTSVDYEGD